MAVSVVSISRADLLHGVLFSMSDKLSARRLLLALDLSLTGVSLAAVLGGVKNRVIEGVTVPGVLPRVVGVVNGLDGVDMVLTGLTGMSGFPVMVASPLTRRVSDSLPSLHSRCLTSSVAVARHQPGDGCQETHVTSASWGPRRATGPPGLAVAHRTARWSLLPLARYRPHGDRDDLMKKFLMEAPVKVASGLK